MNTFEKIQLIAKNLDIPAWPDVYSGSDANRPAQWITYNLADNRGSLFGDDEPGAVIHWVQVHLFMPANKNFFAIQKAIRDAMFSAGFTFPEITNLIDEHTTASSGTQKIRHIVFESEIEDDTFYEEE